MFKACQTLVVTGIAIALSACGAADKKKAASGAAAVGGNFDIPSINFQLPSTQYGLDLAPNDDKLLDTEQRVNDRIDKLNADMVKWKGEFTEVGTFTGKGPSNDKSGSLTKVSEGSYEYKLIVCEKGSLHMVVKWSEDGKNIYSWRDQRYKPEPEDSRVLMIFSETDAGKALTQQFYGVKDKSPAGVDETSLADRFEAKQSAAGAFTFSGTEDWFSGTRTAGAADGYLVASLDETGATGQFVNYRSGAPGCDASFTEATPNWCKANTVANSTATNADKATVWTALQALSLAVVPAASLEDPTVTETCPSAN